MISRLRIGHLVGATLALILCTCAQHAPAAGSPGNLEQQVPGSKGIPSITKQQKQACAEQGGCVWVTREFLMDLIHKAQEQAYQKGYENGRLKNGSAT
jgi:hypothetical protein